MVMNPMMDLRFKQTECTGVKARWLAAAAPKHTSKKTVTSADSQDRVKTEYAAHVSFIFSVIDPFELHLVLKALFCNNDEAPILTLIYLDYM